MKNLFLIKKNYIERDLPDLFVYYHENRRLTVFEIYHLYAYRVSNVGVLRTVYLRPVERTNRRIWIQVPVLKTKEETNKLDHQVLFNTQTE